MAILVVSLIPFMEETMQVTRRPRKDVVVYHDHVIAGTLGELAASAVRASKPDWKAVRWAHLSAHRLFSERERAMAKVEESLQKDGFPAIMIKRAIRLIFHRSEWWRYENVAVKALNHYQKAYRDGTEEEKRIAQHRCKYYSALLGAVWVAKRDIFSSPRKERAH